MWRHISRNVIPNKKSNLLLLSCMMTSHGFIATNAYIYRCNLWWFMQLLYGNMAPGLRPGILLFISYKMLRPLTYCKKYDTAFFKWRCFIEKCNQSMISVRVSTLVNPGGKLCNCNHEDVMTWKLFPHYWPFVLVTKGQYCGALFFFRVA